MRILIFLLAVCVSYTSAFEECQIGVNLLVVDNKRTSSHSSTEGSVSDTGSASSTGTAWTVLQKSTLTYQLEPTVSALGDGLALTGEVPNMVDEESTTPRLPTRLAQRLQCTLPTAAVDSYDVELSILAHNITQPDHSYLLLTAKPILEEESNDDVRSPNIADVQVRFSGRPGSEPVTLPFSSSISRVPLSPRIKSFDFVLDFDDVITNGLTFITFVLLNRTAEENIEKRFLMPFHSERFIQETGTQLLPPPNIPAFQEGVASDSVSALRALHWRVVTPVSAIPFVESVTSTIPTTFQAPHLTILDAENGHFDFCVVREEADIPSDSSSSENENDDAVESKSKLPPFTLKSHHEFYYNHPFAIRLSGQFYIVNVDTYDIDGNTQIELSVVVHCLLTHPEESMLPTYVASKSTYTVSADHFASMASSEIPSTDTSGSTFMPRDDLYIPFHHLVHLPPNMTSIDIFLKIYGTKNIEFAHVRMVKATPMFLTVLQDAPAITGTVITLIVFVVIAVLCCVGLMMYVWFRRGGSRPDGTWSTVYSHKGKSEQVQDQQEEQQQVSHIEIEQLDPALEGISMITPTTRNAICDVPAF